MFVRLLSSVIGFDVSGDSHTGRMKTEKAGYREKIPPNLTVQGRVS
jgi:hypothetical protein